MERDEGGLSPEQVLRAVLTRKKAFGVSFIAGAFVFGAAAAAIPPSYKASVIMTIDPGRYPNDFLRPNVIPDLETRLGGMQKMLESAPVIEELRVRTGLAAKDKPGGGGLLEALGFGSDPIDGWRKAFKFEVPQDIAQTGNRRVDTAPLVEMTFKNSDPEMAARVVNECARRANEENARFRRAFVEEVVRFIQKAQERAKEVARQREEAFNSFKLSNLDKLPEQEAFIAAKLGQLRIRYADLKNSERFAESRMEQLTSERGLLVAQIALNVQIAAQLGGDAGTDKDTPTELRRERLRLVQELERREDDLTQLESGYTAAEPRVKALKELVDKSKARIDEIDAKLRTLGLMGMDPAVAPVVSETPIKEEFRPKHDHKLFDDDPYEKKGQRIPNAPLAPRLGSPQEKPAPKDKAADDKLAKQAEKTIEKTIAPVMKTGRVVDVLSGEKIDEKTLQSQLDEMSYRLVVSNPGYGRIRQIDFAVKDTGEALKDLRRQREESFADIRKAEDQLASIPEVRQRLEALGRDLIESRQDYQKLSDQLDNAKKALEVENEGKGEQFRVIDFARPPSKPSGPGRPIFVALAMAVAFGAAAALCVLLDLRARGVLDSFLATPGPAPTPKKETA